MELKIQVMCHHLPGAKVLGAPTQNYENVFLGMQEGDTVVGAEPASRERVVFEPTFRVAPLSGGLTNFLGPFAKGTPTERFFYLSWVTKGPYGDLRMFRRAKILLSHVPWERVVRAIQLGNPLRVE
ncbi:MAG: hypothetical protein H7Y12_04620, partial [Sphingobacteriaceae bacterium]|nr:hypothetical protein [Cytophagaceae bacterium]